MHLTIHFLKEAIMKEKSNNNKKRNNKSQKELKYCKKKLCH
jgi:hypothetical protein